MKRTLRCRAFLLGVLILGIAPMMSPAAPNPTHFIIRADQIDFTSDATDADLFILDEHPEFTGISFGNGPWDGPDPRLFPIKITDAGFAHVAKCPRLERLSLSFIHPMPITAAGLNALAGLTNLEELWFDGNDQFDDTALIPLGHLPKLRVLRFCGAPITSAGLRRIRGLTQLEDLQLGLSRVDDAGLRVIGGFAKLKTLDLQHTRVTDAGLAHLQSLTNLTWLCLNGTAIGDLGVARLTKLTRLQWLLLEDTSVDDAVLDELRPLADLRTLHLSGTRLTDAGVEKLARFPRLDYLHLSGLPLTDTAIDSLLRMKSLKTVEINSTKISPATLDRLAAAGVQIYNRGNEYRPVPPAEKRL